LHRDLTSAVEEQVESAVVDGVITYNTFHGREVAVATTGVVITISVAPPVVVAPIIIVIPVPIVTAIIAVLALVGTWLN
jgi:hypothetical protein